MNSMCYEGDYHRAEIFARRKILPISPPAPVGEIILSTIFFFSCANDYIDDMATFTALVKSQIVELLTYTGEIKRQ